MAAVVSLLANASAFAQTPPPPSPVVTIAVNSGPTPNPAGLVNGAMRQVVTRLTASVSFNPAAVPYSGTMTGPAWQWRTVGATVAGKADGAPLPAPVGSYSSTFSAPTLAATNVNLTFTQPGWWVVTVAAAATYTDTNGASWSGEAYQDIAVIVVSGGGGTNGNGTVSVLPKKSAICAGGIANPVHQTEVMIVVMDPLGNAVGNARVQLTVDKGQISPAMAMTDPNGVCTVTLTSSVVSADPSAASNVGTGIVTAKWVDPMNINTVFGIGTGGVAYEAPTFSLYASPRRIQAPQAAACTGYLVYGSDPVEGHVVNWKLDAIWDSSRNPVDLPQASQYGSIQPVAGGNATNSQGKCSANFAPTSASSYVEIMVLDASVLQPQSNPPSALDDLHPNAKTLVFANLLEKMPEIDLWETTEAPIRGVYGDWVSSVLAPMANDHFVTPRYAKDIDGSPTDIFNHKQSVWLQGGVMAQVDGKETFKPFDPAKYNWKITDQTNMGRVAGAAANPTSYAYVDRTATAKVRVEIVDIALGKAVTFTYVWVVWADITECQYVMTDKKEGWTLGANVPLGPPLVDVNQVPTNGSGANKNVDVAGAISAGWVFVATIQPPEILKGVDIPHLMQPNGETQIDQLLPTPPPNSPADKPTMYRHILTNLPIDDANQGRGRWDLARQLRMKILSPTVAKKDWQLIDGIMLDSFNVAPDKLPKDFVLVEDYPTNPVVGNDTVKLANRKTNPYVNTEILQVRVYVNGRAIFKPFANNKSVNPNGFGQLCSTDRPILPAIAQAAGMLPGEVVDARVHFREFARLQIGNAYAGGDLVSKDKYNYWYRISDFRPWRLDHRLKKGANGWDKDGANRLINERNNDGW